MRSVTASQRFEPWLFYGGSVALDFVNTLRDRATTPRETLTSPETLRVWAGQARLVPPESGFGVETSITDQDLSDCLDLRESIDALLVPQTALHSRHILLVNRWAAAAPRQEIDESDPELVITKMASIENVFGVLAADAISIIAQGEQSRIKVCSHQRCGIRFIDRSRSQQRLWCSMQRCGNRAKVARHAAGRDNKS
ncbi:hypothetical protein EB836_10380 [Brevibacterium sp. S111]|nr:hypothetical protein EB836_10380 [Brevibacterium sp. S111]